MLSEVVQEALYLGDFKIFLNNQKNIPVLFMSSIYAVY